MLREGRCLREVFETARRVYGDSDSTPTRWGHYYLTLAALKNIPGDFLSDTKRAEIKRVAVEVVKEGTK